MCIIKTHDDVFRFFHSQLQEIDFAAKDAGVPLEKRRKLFVDVVSKLYYKREAYTACRIDNNPKNIWDLFESCATDLKEYTNKLFSEEKES